MKLSAWVIGVCCVLLLQGCPLTPTAPTPATQRWGWAMPLPAVPPGANTTVSTLIYGGGTVREMTPDLRIAGLGGALAEVSLLTPGGTLLRRWRAADLTPGSNRPPGVPTIAGNAFRLSVSLPAGAAWPSVRIEQIATTVATTLPEAGALALAPGDTVDALLEPSRPLFLQLAAGAEAIDFVALGAADLRLADPAGNGHIIDPALAWARLQTQAAASEGLPPGGWLRVPAEVARPTRVLRLTWAVTPAQPTGVARLVVGSVQPDLKLAFPARDRGAFFPFWFGVDRDGRAAPACAFAAGDPRCALDQLRCSDHAGRGGLVPGPLGTELPRGTPVCYDTHEGTDFGLVGAVLGQAMGVDVTAAADGVVVVAQDGNADDCFYSPFSGGIRCRDVAFQRPFWDELRTGPETPANRVAVLQADGHMAWYYHLRRGTVAVVAGQRVRCGTKLGQVGSSGNSSGPHLHFELRAPRTGATIESLAWSLMRDTTNTIDPFPGRWVQWSEGSVPGNTCP
jgi:Peptidase family M23